MPLHTPPLLPTHHTCRSVTNVVLVDAYSHRTFYRTTATCYHLPHRLTGCRLPGQTGYGRLLPRHGSLPHRRSCGFTAGVITAAVCCTRWFRLFTLPPTFVLLLHTHATRFHTRTRYTLYALRYLPYHLFSLALHHYIHHNYTPFVLAVCSFLVCSFLRYSSLDGLHHLRVIAVTVACWRCCIHLPCCVPLHIPMPARTHTCATPRRCHAFTHTHHTTRLPPPPQYTPPPPSHCTPYQRTFYLTTATTATHTLQHYHAYTWRTLRLPHFPPPVGRLRTRACPTPYAYVLPHFPTRWWTCSGIGSTVTYCSTVDTHTTRATTHARTTCHHQPV